MGESSAFLHMPCSDEGLWAHRVAAAAVTAARDRVSHAEGITLTDSASLPSLSQDPQPNMMFVPCIKSGENLPETG